MLHYSNALAYNAQSIQQFQAEQNIAVLEQLPYSPNLDLYDLSFLQAQGDHQEDLFWRCGGHQEGSNDRVERYPRRIFPAVHGIVADKDRNMYN